LSLITPAALDPIALRDLIQRRVSPGPAPQPLRDWRRFSSATSRPVDLDRPQGLSVLLTRRASHLPHHAGQISFPGGRLESGDADAAATALRETEEEIGLDRRFISVVGYLPDHLIPISGYRVTPVVSFVTPGFELKTDPREVEEAFEVPLGFLLDPANHVPRQREYSGVSVEFIDMPFGPHHIWGATAGMLYTLYRLLCGEGSAA